MNHPFDLDPAELEAMDLDFEETLTDELRRPHRRWNHFHDSGCR
jgi:hypothetical protein